MTLAEEFAALQKTVVDFGGRIQRAAETSTGSAGDNAILEKLFEKYSGLQRVQRSAQLETKYYPLWKPLDFETYAADWARLGMAGNAFSKALAATGEFSAAVLKAVDSNALGPLIRQDLEQTLYEVYVKKFPFFDMLEKIPANGLVHAWNQETAFGDAQFITELGTVTDDATTYGRLTANMAILATRRGISLKAKFAVNAGGMTSYDPEQREITAGLNAIAHKAQVGVFRLQDTNNAATTATDPNGLFDANAFNGLRYFLQNVAPGANTFTVDGTVTPAVGTHPFTDAVQAATNALIDAGGTPSLIIGSVSGRQKIIGEQTSFVRFDGNNTTEVVPGLRVMKIVAGDNELPIMVVPGDSTGTYIIGGQTFIDLYILDMDQLSWAYLGAAGPNVLEIPMGTDGTLRQLYIPYMMGGLVPNVPQFMARVKIRIA